MKHVSTSQSELRFKNSDIYYQTNSNDAQLMISQRMRGFSHQFWLWSSHYGAFSGTWSTDIRCVFLPNLGGDAWIEHTHLPEFLIHCSEAELLPRAARLLRQHAESGLQQQISLSRPDASRPGWCCGVKIKQTPVSKPKEAKVKLRVWFTLLLTPFQLPVLSQLSHVGRRFYCHSAISKKQEIY